MILEFDHIRVIFEPDILLLECDGIVENKLASTCKNISMEEFQRSGLKALVNTKAMFLAKDLVKMADRVESA